MWGESTMFAPHGAARAAAKNGFGSCSGLPCIRAPQHNE